VTSDANGNIVQLWGRNIDDGTIWKVAHEFNYEQQLTRILLNNGDTVANTYDGFGYRLKEVTTSGGTPTEKRLIPILGNRVIQERDSSDTVTARYYWEKGHSSKRTTGVARSILCPRPGTARSRAGTTPGVSTATICGIPSA
jgi:YD repeat-containing protein